MATRALPEARNGVEGWRINGGNRWQSSGDALLHLRPHKRQRWRFKKNYLLHRTTNDTGFQDLLLQMDAQHVHRPRYHFPY